MYFWDRIAVAELADALGISRRSTFCYLVQLFYWAKVEAPDNDLRPIGYAEFGKAAGLPEDGLELWRAMEKTGWIRELHLVDRLGIFTASWESTQAEIKEGTFLLLAGTA